MSLLEKHLLSTKITNQLLDRETVCNGVNFTFSTEALVRCAPRNFSAQLCDILCDFAIDSRTLRLSSKTQRLFVRSGGSRQAGTVITSSVERRYFSPRFVNYAEIFRKTLAE